MNSNTINIIKNYFQSQPVEKAWVFGSFARGEERPDSDIDIMVAFVEGTKIGFRFAGMVCELEDLLHREVDLVVEGSLFPFAAESAEREKKLIYERAC